MVAQECAAEKEKNAGTDSAENVSENLNKNIAPLIDMTVSSPVRVGLPVELDSAVDSARKQFGHWSPDASGWREAREAVAAYYRERGGVFTSNQIIVTASTSEAYSVLFKTFCDPGDVILTPMPGYPLLDTLAQLEHLECAPYFLKLVREKPNGGLRSLAQLKDSVNGCKNGASKATAEFRFVIDTDSLLAAPEKSRILLLVSPHNPTGHIVSLKEWNEIVRFCEENHLILVVDEVFGDYCFSDEVKRSWQYLRSEARGARSKSSCHPREELSCHPRKSEDLAVQSSEDTSRSPVEPGMTTGEDFFDCGGNDIVFAPIDGPKCPIFWLNGLSKAVGAPQLKFGWMAFYAPRERFEEIRAALEFVEDAYLSTSSCAQALATPLLARAAEYESQVTARLKQNWETLHAAFPSKYCPMVLGGWYAVVHLGEDDEELTLRLLREKHVLVQPGFFFDFEEDGWIVISLLQEPALFEKAVQRMAELLS